MDRRKVRILEPPDRGDAAATVRRRSGQVLVTDGPLAETKEWIGAFDILECVNLDEAIDIAATHPVARFGRIEIRPFWHIRARQAPLSI